MKFLSFAVRRRSAFGVRLFLGIDEHAYAVFKFETSLRQTDPVDANMSWEREMDEKISGLFQEWLSAFQTVQVASGEEAIAKAQNSLSEIEERLAATPAEGMQGLAVKLGLHCFLNDHADAASAQSESAYRDLVRLTGHDPAVEIAARFQKEAA
jgi:hypothetical protein